MQRIGREYTPRRTTRDAWHTPTTRFMTTAVDRRAKSFYRLLIWSLPVILAGGLSLAVREVTARATLSEAGCRLVAGDVAGARQLLAGLSGWRQSPTRSTRAVTSALAGDEPLLQDEATTLDATTFPLALMTRTAFERGDFQEALHLTALAERLGQTTVPALTAAALIENGRSDEARSLLLSQPPPGTLGRRIARHLRAAREHRGVLLRDRRGRPVGTAAGGALELFDETPPEIVPRAAAAVALEPEAASAGALRAKTGSLRLSLDLELSAAAYAAFGSRYRGSIVLLDARDGEVLAGVSDRRTFLAGGTAAFEQQREPASISKLITAVAARRSGLDPDAELARMRCRGHERYSGEMLYCPYIAGPLRGLDRALAVSCNVAFANLGVRVGWRGMLGELQRFGFGTNPGPMGHVAFPAGRILAARGNDRRLADLSIGLEWSEITPLHAALVAAAFANRGVMPEPTLLIGEGGRLDLRPRPRAEGRRVADSSWVPEILEAIEEVVRRGTASRVAPAIFPVAMKTGTASDPRYGFHVNYIGVGPMPAPWLAFCVRITDQPSSRKVRRAAREVTWRFLRSLGRIATDRGWIDRAPPPSPPRLAAVAPASPKPRPARPPTASPSAIAAR